MTKTPNPERREAHPAAGPRSPGRRSPCALLRPILLLLLLLLLGCGFFERPPVRPPSIVLISVDGLRADRVGPGSAVATPSIDGLAATGVHFPEAWSHTPLTLPSHVSIFTGLLPHLHGIRDERGYPIDGERFPWLPSLLRAQGYATGGFVSSWPLSGLPGLRVGFDRWDDMGAEPQDPQRAGSEVIELAREWLSEAPIDRPVFLFLHLAETMSPWRSEDAAGSEARVYDRAVREVDRLVGEVLRLVDARAMAEGSKPVVVLVADHGEGLGEHGEIGHGVLLSEESLRVPLILRTWREGEIGEVRPAPAQLVDLMPTLTALAGIDAPLKHSGHDLLDSSQRAKDAEPRQIYAETWHPRIHLGWSELRSLVEGRWQLVAGARAELYGVGDLGREDRSEEQRRLYARLRRDLARFDRGFRAPAVLEESERLRLARFGVWGMASNLAEAVRPDPRDRLGSLRHLQEAWQLYRADRLEEAARAFAAVLAENPWLLDVREARAEALLRAGLHDAAAEAFREALRVSEGDPRLAALASRAYLEAGELDEALDLAHFVLEGGAGDDPPQEILVRLGEALIEAGRAGEVVGLLRPLADDERPAILAALAWAMSESGDLPGALTILQRLETLRPDEARTHEVLGLVELRVGRLAEAEDRVRRALALDGERAASWELLGDVLDRAGNTDEALRAWQKAVELDPRAWDVRLTLGCRAAELSRPRLARTHLEKFVDGAPEARWSQERREARRLLRELPAEGR